MKAKEVLKILGISRPALSRYVKQGLVKVDSVINGKYRYNSARNVYRKIKHERKTQIDVV